MVPRAFKGLGLEMEGSRCLLESEPFPLEYLLQLSTSMMEDPPQVFSYHFTVKCLSEVQHPITAVTSSNSTPGDAPAHGRAVSVSSLPLCRPDDYVLVADCINPQEAKQHLPVSYKGPMDMSRFPPELFGF